MKLSKSSIIAALVLAIGGTAGLTAAATREALQVSEKQPFGKYLSSEGRAVYMFTADSEVRSACYDACAQAWPPVLSAGNPKAETGLDTRKLGIIKRKDGSSQVTYGGMPLYYFVQDQKPGSTAGEGIKHFGGEWYLVSPQGKKIDQDS